MQEERQELIARALRKAQKELEELGLTVLIAPCAMPQGLTMSLTVGESEEAIVASYTAQQIGAEFAQTADSKDAQRFAVELSVNIADRSIYMASARPPTE